MKTRLSGLREGRPKAAQILGVSQEELFGHGRRRAKFDAQESSERLSDFQYALWLEQFLDKIEQPTLPMNPR